MPTPPPLSAPELLREAAGIIEQRASERDLPRERSMRRAVDAFNALYGENVLTENEGWVFLGLLKLSRATAGRFNRDDLLDAAAYLALALEHQLEVQHELHPHEPIIDHDGSEIVSMPAPVGQEAVYPDQGLVDRLHKAAKKGLYQKAAVAYQLDKDAL